jgi:hypothetical protein
MSAENTSSTETSLPEWFDPFPEPHTLPDVWNLDSILPTLAAPTVERADTPLEDPHG